MKIVQRGATVNVTEVHELAAGNACHFKAAVRAALSSRPNQIDIDLSQTKFLDCKGIGALIALRKTALQRNARATVRLLRPALSASFLLRLTRLDSLFPIKAS
jgi:anti-anti-sigma factor